ncbi:methyltransferase domain-containing protein [Hoyosella sp. YIM 151337]|uniref:class I SAM-dependent methyltransferase n=1 Tax=Hoyosella sp. YIM 151337 TaxID=2992742 RepID=UPI00223655D5|nr:methyltransferase domain-containing protein [Hoyosella sp. YIM 151337]MCW4355998.1 methyltransferase domain-containing protein [Hoyosella sp. YIM 151337]
MSRWQDTCGGPGGRNGEDYQRHFERLAATGKDTHGEARLCAELVAPGARVLDAGCGTGRVAIWLQEHGYHCVGVDLDESMLDVARRRAPELNWIHGDLADLDAASLGTFDLVVAAGNVIPLVASGTEQQVVECLASVLKHGGILVAGFGLDAAHLPLDDAPLTLDDYDGWCESSGLRLEHRFATWHRDPYVDGGYAVSVHRRFAT